MSMDTVQCADIKLHLNTEVFQINFLPRELLPKIFKRLNAHDRKNVRLTCRLWNEVCNLREIIEYEKFVFHLGKEGCGFPELGAYIEECQALRSCLEFQGLPLCQLPLTLWANIGERVQSLFIHECEVDDATISNIIIHCINLKTLHLQSVVDLPHLNLPATLSSDPATEFFTKEGIDELIKRNIERRNLTSLILYSHEVLLLSTRKLRKLFQIFPCLQTVGEGMLVLKNSGIYLCRHKKIEWVFPPTLENFVSNEEDIILNNLKISNSKLKELSTVLNFNFTRYDLFLDSCYEQKELEKLALDVARRDGTDILLLILRSFPKLKELEFHASSPPEFWYSPEKLSEFFILTSKLESMWLNFRSFSLNEVFSPVIASSIILLSPLAEYSTLKSLTVSRMIDIHFIYEILRRCRTSLHHLSVMEVNDEIIKLILEAHTELKTLIISLDIISKLNNDGSVPQGKKYPFGKLKNLEYLRLYCINLDTLRNNMSEFIFPKLKYFEFNYPFLMWPRLHVDLPPDDAVQDFHTMLRVVCKGAPHLETLKIRNCVFKSIDFVNLFRNVQMKCLRYITIYSLMDPYTEKLLTTKSDKHFGSIDAIFNVCPSLCSISFGWDGRCTYFYNRQSKEIKRYSYLKTFDSIQTLSTISCLNPRT